MIKDPKNPCSLNLDTQSANIANIAKAPVLGVIFAHLRVKYIIIHKKLLQILDHRPKNLYGPNLVAESAKIAKIPPFRGNFC